MLFSDNSMELKCYSFIIALVFCIVNANGIFERSSGEIYYQGNNISDSSETVLYNHDHLEKTDLQEDPCTANPCKNDGSCSLDNGKAKCSCKESYYGEFCDERCKCENGKCEEQSGKVKCICDPEYGLYKGICKACECGNGANCTFTGIFATKTCLCPIGFEQKSGKCQDLCTVNHCKNGGTCLLDNGKVKCSCKESYYGEFCDEMCKCENGKCETVEGALTCFCNAEYGYYENGVCKACHCGKGANCTFDLRRFWDIKTCICPKGYEVHKEICVDPKDQNPCNSQPCQNGGNCSRIGFEPVCRCPQRYYGDWCEKDYCQPNPCNNGGNCNVVNKVIKCLCEEPFTGDKCQTNSCFSNPCQNGGTCLVEGMGFRCQCKDFFSGDKCEKNNRITFYFLVLVLLGVAICFTVGCCLFKMNENLKMMLKHYHTPPSTLP